MIQVQENMDELFVYFLDEIPYNLGKGFLTMDHNPDTI